MELLLSELEDCVPAPDPVDRVLEAKELGEVITSWLRSLPATDRRLFLRRYWNGEALKDLAAELHEKPERLAQQMLRLRRALRKRLEQEGISL